jgi:hypothetical protein
MYTRQTEFEDFQSSISKQIVEDQSKLDKFYEFVRQQAQGFDQQVQTLVKHAMEQQAVA